MESNTTPSALLPVLVSTKDTQGYDHRSVTSPAPMGTMKSWKLRASEISPAVGSTNIGTRLRLG
jgi:hypothetical protein